MNLIAPWFLLGAALIAGPIIFHLIRRANKDRIEFSAMQFLEESPPRLQKRSRIQNPWLLALRCAIVALLAFAFARPFLSNALQNAVPETAARHVAILLDESASMRRDGLWSGATLAVRKIASDLDLSDHLALFAASDAALPLISFERWKQTPPDERLDLLNAVLESRAPQWTASYLDTGFDAAIEEIDAWASAEKNIASRQIFLVSDFSEGSRVSGLAGRAWPDGLTFHPTLVEPKSAGNASLSWLGWLETPGAPLQARLLLRSTSTFKPATLTLAARDARSSASIGVPQELVTRADENRLILFPVPQDKNTPLVFELGGDNASFDNLVYAVPPQLREISVSYLGEASPADPQRSTLYLSKAAGAWTDPLARIQSSTSPSDLLIIDQALSANQAADILLQIQNGAYAIILLSNTDRAATLDALANESGWSIRPLPVNDARIGTIDFQHPLFSLFSDPRFSDFSRIRFWQPFGITPPQNSAAAIAARFEDGSPAVLEIAIGKGRLIAWGSDWSPKASQWALSTKFVPWLQKIAERRLGGPKRASHAELGDTSPLLIQPTETWNTGKTIPTEPGVYQLSDDGRTRSVALNIPRSESLTDPLSLDTWEQLGLPLDAAQTPKDKEALEAVQRVRLAAEIESSQQGWRWIFLLAALFLAAESLIARRQTRREASAQ